MPVLIDNASVLGYNYDCNKKSSWLSELWFRGE